MAYPGKTAGFAATTYPGRFAEPAGLRQRKRLRQEKPPHRQIMHTDKSQTRR